jgi:hypothetical protein
MTCHVVVILNLGGVIKADLPSVLQVLAGGAVVGKLVRMLTLCALVLFGHATQVVDTGKWRGRAMGDLEGTPVVARKVVRLVEVVLLFAR